MWKRKGYFGLDWVISLVLAIIPVTSWICGGIERILRGHIIAGILQFIPPFTVFFWVADIVTMIVKRDLTIFA